MSFYVTLPSSSFKNGADAEYRTTLQCEIVLPEDDWNVALVNFQYIGQKWGSLTNRERTIGIQLNAPIEKKFVMDWSSVGPFILYVNTTSTELVRRNYTWEELQQEIQGVFATTVLAHNIGRKKLGQKPIKGELKFLSVDNLVITKDEESEFYVTFSPALSALLGMIVRADKAVIIKCTPGVTFFPKTYVEPYIISKSVQVIHFPSSASADYSFSVTLGVGSQPKLTTLYVPHGYWSHTMLCQYLTDGFSKRNVNCSFVLKDVKENRTDDKVELSGTIKCTINSTSTSIAVFGNDFKRVCGIYDTNDYKQGMTTQFDYSFKVNLKLVGHEPKIFRLIKSSFGNIETICNVLNKTIAKEFDTKETVFNFELKQPHVIINAPQKTKYNLRMERSLLKNLGFISHAVDASKPDDTFVWLTFSENKIKGESLTQIEEQSPHYLLQGQNIPAFWVHSNIIDDQFVGESCIPLLRVVSNNAAENVPHMENLDAQYLPLCTRRINSIKLKLCAGPNDEPLQFDNEVTCILHFMRRS